MVSYRFSESDLSFLKKYCHLFSKPKLSFNIAYNLFHMIGDPIIMAIWWACVAVVLTSLCVKYLCSSILITRLLVDKLYQLVLYSVSKLLECIQYVYPNHSRKSIIYDKGSDDPYLERYYLLIKDRDTFACNVFLHKFMKGDEDDIHDHPWGFFHIILSGGYWEYVTVNQDGETLDQGIKKVWRAAGHYNMATSDYKHRIVLGDENPWTLFIPFKKVAKWGFFVPMLWQSCGPCIEGSTKNDKNMSCTQWRKIPHDTYLSKKEIDQDN